MKKYIQCFIGASLAVLLIVPVHNISADLTGPKNILKKPTEWFSNGGAYNIDFMLPYAGYALHKFGISISPEKTVIGKDGWLFLGDHYVNVMSEARGLTAFNKQKIDRITNARHEWDAYAKSHGSAGYFVTIAPNSHTIYREKMPDWASASNESKNITYLLKGEKEDNTLFDISKTIRQQKPLNSHDLYYKTDTHWNAIGGWYGYQEMAKQIGALIPSIKWLQASDVRFTFSERKGGDLSSFLRINNSVKDTDVKANVNLNTPITVSDWGNKVLRHTNIDDRITEMNQPLVVRSKGALNDMKVLWLRDSYGMALYPYMNATFSTIMQQHYQWVINNPKILKGLIDRYKPDIIILTVVERNSLENYFMNAP